MFANLLMHIFGVGRIPAARKAELAHEGIVLLEEGRWGSITYRNYRSPNRISSWRKQGILGAIALTSQRVVVYGYKSCLIDVPYAHPTSQALAISTEGERLAFAFEASAFHSDRSGSITVRLGTPQAALIAEQLRQRIQAAQGH